MFLVGALLLAFFVLPPPFSYLAVIGGAIVEVGETAAFIWWTKRRRAAVGVETLVGAVGEVVTPCRPLGQVKIRGELWAARCAAGAGRGERVAVTRVEGLMLVVEPVR